MSIAAANTNKVYLILHNIRSLHNVGSMFRTADAFGITKIYLCGYTGMPMDRLGRPVKEIAKTALGAEKTVPWEYARQTGRVIEKLKKQGVTILALENNVPGAVDVARVTPKGAIALIVGNEVRGTPKSLRRRTDAVIAIPMRGAKESLNVSVACGVALYALLFINPER